MDQFEKVDEETFVSIQKHFLKYKEMKFHINRDIVPSCITIYMGEEIVARAHLPNTPSMAAKYSPEYVVRQDIFDKYFWTKD